MNIKKTIFGVILTIFIGFSLVPTSPAATVISIFAEGPLADVASFQASIISPDTASVVDFTPNFPDGWEDYSSDKLLSAFDGTGSASLPTGQIGSFSLDVVLGGWELTNQAAHEDLLRRAIRPIRPPPRSRMADGSGTGVIS